MADTFKKLVTGIKPGASSLVEWFAVPSGFEYQGTIRVSNVGASVGTYRIAGVNNTGIVPADHDYEAYNTEIETGEIHDLTFDLGGGEAVLVYSDTGDVVFNFRGLSIA